MTISFKHTAGVVVVLAMATLARAESGLVTVAEMLTWLKLRAERVTG